MLSRRRQQRRRRRPLLPCFLPPFTFHRIVHIFFTVILLNRDDRPLRRRPHSLTSACFLFSSQTRLILSSERASRRATRFACFCFPKRKRRRRRRALHPVDPVLLPPHLSRRRTTMRPPAPASLYLVLSCRRSATLAAAAALTDCCLEIDGEREESSLLFQLPTSNEPTDGPRNDEREREREREREERERERETNDRRPAQRARAPICPSVRPSTSAMPVCARSREPTYLPPWRRQPAPARCMPAQWLCLSLPLRISQPCSLGRRRRRRRLSGGWKDWERERCLFQSQCVPLSWAAFLRSFSCRERQIMTHEKIGHK